MNMTDEYNHSFNKHLLYIYSVPATSVIKSDMLTIAYLLLQGQDLAQGLLLQVYGQVV